MAHLQRTVNLNPNAMGKASDLKEEKTEDNVAKKLSHPVGNWVEQSTV